MLSSTRECSPLGGLRGAGAAGGCGAVLSCFAGRAVSRGLQPCLLLRRVLWVWSTEAGALGTHGHSGMCPLRGSLWPLSPSQPGTATLASVRPGLSVPARGHGVHGFCPVSEVVSVKQVPAVWRLSAIVLPEVMESVS